MSIKEDAAVKLNEAYEAALITPHPYLSFSVRLSKEGSLCGVRR